MSLLSVVIPTHNRADDLGRAVSSVLAQEVRDLEVVVVDDASTDSTAEVLARITDDRRVKVVSSEQQLGPCAARNLGISEARGELLGFCDDDDIWLPGAANVLLEELAANPSLGAVSSWHEVSHDELAKVVTFRGPLQYDHRQLLWQNLIALPFAILRRPAFSFEISFDPDLPTGEDWDLWLRCAEERLMRTIPRSCYLYSQHGRSRVTRTAAAQIAGRRNFLTKHGDKMSPACRLYHHAVLSGYEGGRGAMAKILTGHSGADTRDAAFVSLVLASSLAASRLGQRRQDPGLQARIMARMVGSRESRSGRRGDARSV